MIFDEISVRFCGIAGDGIVTSGKILSSACASVGLHVMVNDIYSAAIRGLGKSTTTVRFSVSTVYSMGDGIDCLIGMAAHESISEIKDVKSGGHIIYESSTPKDISEEESIAAHITPKMHGIGVPLKWLANEASGTNRGRNLVAMGVLCYLYSLPEEIFTRQR